MKTTIIFLISLLMAQLAWSNTQNQLPEEPWRAIVNMEKYSPGIGWEDNISIKLFGSYTQTDSFMIENSIKILNELSETVKLSITSHDLGNLEIFFLDSMNEKTYESRIVQGKDVNSKYSIDYNYHKIDGVWMTKSIRHYDQSFRLALIPKNFRQNFITNSLVYALYPKTLSLEYMYKRGKKIFTQPNSIFNQKYSEKKLDQWIDHVPNFYSELSPFDRLLIKTVYTSNFAELFLIAKKQFEPIPSWLQDNVKKILIFPFVLALFLLTGIILLFYQKLGVKIKNKLLQFNAISILSLIMVGIFAALYFVSSSHLADPYFSFFQTIDIVAIMVFSIILGLLALNMIRLIEIAINRKTEYKYFKVFLLFISTSLIPSFTCFAIYYFTPLKSSGQAGINLLSILFLVFVIVGIIRALISFFILKEKELKIETELKLSALREMKTRAELNALHSKINPHFLYNSLNSIAGLAKTNADKTEHMALSLSKLFRNSINKEQSDWSTFAEEMEMVRIYLDIEKVRFDDRLEFSIDLPEELKSVRIPQFLIQPLVENAIKHGISKLVSRGIVKITFRKVFQWTEIEVADNGPGFPIELNPGFGLQSIYDKLEILYPDRFELHFLNSPNKHILIKLA